VIDTLATAQAAPTAKYPRRASSTFAALVGRDLRVLRRNLGPFTGQVILQPLLLVFTFTYVLPHIGAGFSSGFAGYPTLLIPGMLAGVALSTGISTVTTPLAADLGGAREIDDRILAPISITGVAIEKILMGAVNAWLAALLVLPICELVSATPIHLHIGSWPVFTAAFTLLGITSGALGLSIGTLVKPHQVGILYGVFVIPIQFLGCVYYPWSQLQSIRWVQLLTLANPLTYLSEATRAGLTSQVHHMPAVISLGAASALATGLTALAARLLRRRVQS
jgi:ABC-2 type transport system permease protein